MATVTPGVPAYGTISNTRQSIYEAPHYRGEEEFSHPGGAMTVNEGIALINETVAGATVTTATSTGYASRVEA